MLLEHLATASGKLIMLGDFNFHVDDTNNASAMKFLDIVNCFNLAQHIIVPSFAGPYLAGGQGGQSPPQRFDKVTITLLEVSSLPPSNKRKYISTAPLLKNVLVRRYQPIKMAPQLIL